MIYPMSSLHHRKPHPPQSGSLPIQPAYAQPADNPTIPITGMDSWTEPTFAGITPTGSAPVIVRVDAYAQPGDAVTWAGDSLTSGSTLEFFAPGGTLTAGTQIYSDSANVRVVTIPSGLTANRLYFTYPRDTTNGYGTPDVIGRATV